MKNLKSLVEQWSIQLAEIDGKLKAIQDIDYIALQADYIRLQRCTIQAQNVILNKMSGSETPDVNSDVAVVLPDILIPDENEDETPV